MEALKIVYGLFGATVFLALLISIFQLVVEKQKIYFYSVLYWSSVLLSSIINVFVADLHSPLFAFAALGSFISQSVLAKVMCEIRNSNYNFKIPTLFFLILVCFGLILDFNIQLPFEIYASILTIGACFPVFFAAYITIKNKKNSFTSGQILFFVFSIILSLHYLDYPFFKSKPDLFIIASAVAFMLIHTLSALIPMVVNEHSLFIRNNNLENEVRARIADLRIADQQIWESNKLASLGRFSGVLAHELNTPLASISMASQSLLNQIASGKVELQSFSERIKKIKDIVGQISSMTSVLKTAAGDQVGGQFKNFDLKNTILDLERSTQEYCMKKNIQFNVEIKGKRFFSIGNQTEISQVIRNLLFDSIEGQKDIANPWINLSLISGDNTNQISITDSRKVNLSSVFNQDILLSDNSRENLLNNHNFGLNIVVAKAIVESHKGQMEFDFKSEFKRVILTLPINDQELTL